MHAQGRTNGVPEDTIVMQMLFVPDLHHVSGTQQLCFFGKFLVCNGAIPPLFLAESRGSTTDLISKKDNAV